MEKLESTEVYTTSQMRHKALMKSLMSWMKGVRGSSDIEITATSALQSSQKGRITQIVWVPCYNKIGKDGKIISLTAETPTTNLTRQFITSSEDGTVAFWDLKSVFCPLKYIKNIWGEKNQNIPNKIQIFNYNQN